MPDETSKSEATVFYTWQSDLPNKLNRGFIQQALERAAKALRRDDTITVEPVIDRDTADVAGAPDIGATIFAKIERAAVLVCDVSIVSPSGAPRPSPNPNVLIEVGFGLHALGWGRVLLVMNEAYGDPSLLPFDLKTKRVILYRAEDSASNAEQKVCTRQLVDGGSHRVSDGHRRGGGGGQAVMGFTSACMSFGS